MTIIRQTFSIGQQIKLACSYIENTVKAGCNKIGKFITNTFMGARQSKIVMEWHILRREVKESHIIGKYGFDEKLEPYVKYHIGKLKSTLGNLESEFSKLIEKHDREEVSTFAELGYLATLTTEIRETEEKLDEMNMWLEYEAISAVKVSDENSEYRFDEKLEPYVKYHIKKLKSTLGNLESEFSKLIEKHNREKVSTFDELCHLTELTTKIREAKEKLEEMNMWLGYEAISEVKVSTENI